jgi:Cu2+-exporting ATPase
MLFTGLLLTSGAIYIGIEVFKKSRKQKKFVDALLYVEGDDEYADKTGQSTSLLASNEEDYDDDYYDDYYDDDYDDNTEIEYINEPWINRDLTISTISLGLAIAGALFYPPLGLIAASGLVYLTIPIWKETYNILKKERRLSIVLLDAIVLPGLLLGGFIVAAAISYWLFNFSLKLTQRIKNNSEKNVVKMFGEQPRTVWIQQEGCEQEIPLEKVLAGDIVVVQAGETIPVDGLITEGIASVDQQMLTGEAQPVEKEENDSVFAATIVLSGKIYIQVDKTGNETVSAQISQILEETTELIDSVQLHADEIQESWLLPVLGFSALALPVSGLGGALAILNSALPETLQVASPLSILNYLFIASNNGILIKDGRVLESLQQVDTIVFDKTGTLTQEQPHIGKIHTCEQYTEDMILSYAAAAEAKQTHPIARAILESAQDRQLEVPSIQDAHYEIGYGIKVSLNDWQVRVGSARFMALENIPVPDTIQAIQAECSEQGASLVYVAIDNTLAGVIELRSTIRPEAKHIIEQLQQSGYSIVIISGDHEIPTRQLAESLGIESYFAEVLPQRKARLIRKLQRAGKFVCFVGDGINDAIALKGADVSISLRGASTVAMDTAQVILMDGSLSKLLQVFELAGQLEKNLRRSVFITFLPTFICIGGVFFLQAGIYSGIALYYVSMLTGISNAMWPLIDHKMKQPKKLNSQSSDTDKNKSIKKLKTES